MTLKTWQPTLAKLSQPQNSVNEIAVFVKS